jgi:hypothetical protein
MSADSVRVKVGEGWAVHDGKQQRGAGETVEVDADTTDQWETAGWVERVKPATRKRS